MRPTILLPSVVALSLLMPSAPAQGQNARLLAHVDKYPGAVSPTNNYAGVWGMVVNGREIALVTARTGTIVYDCTDPRNPVETGFIPGPGPGGGTGYFWREVNSAGTYAYVSSEHGAAQVIDVSDPSNPKLAGSFGGTMHTVSVDRGTNILWASGGAGSGVILYDLGVNPVNPPQINQRRSPYVHDCLPIRGYAYLAQMFDGTMGILDASDPRNLKTLSTTRTPGVFPHNVWVTDDDKIAVTADENMGGCLTVYDVSNKNAPVQLATWCSPNGATVHNVFIKGSVAHFSSYSDGYWAVDISRPTQPVAIAGYDTTPLGGNDYHGCWGCYPFQPSGVIYLSDMQTGFWIVEPTCGVPNPYGNGTAGTGGHTPAIDFGGGFAKVGNATFEVTGQKLRGGANTLLVFGVGQGQQAVLGIDLLVDLNRPVVTVSATASGTSGSAGAGAVSFGLPIPSSPVMANATFFAQLVAVDPGGPQGLSASRGMKFTICP